MAEPLDHYDLALSDFRLSKRQPALPKYNSMVHGSLKNYFDLYYGSRGWPVRLPKIKAAHGQKMYTPKGLHEESQLYQINLRPWYLRNHSWDVGIRKEKHCPLKAWQYDSCKMLDEVFNWRRMELVKCMSELYTDIITEEVLINFCIKISVDCISKHANAAINTKEMQIQKGIDFICEWAEASVIEPTLSSMMKSTVIQAVREMATSHVDFSHQVAILTELISEHIAETTNEFFDHILEEVQMESIVTEFINSWLSEDLLYDVAVSCLKDISKQISEAQITELGNDCEDKLLDEIYLDVLLDWLVKQGHIAGHDDYADKFLDELLLTNLLREFYHISSTKNLVLDNVPLHKFCRKFAIDVAIDLLTDELEESLNLDLITLNDHETGANLLLDE